jgi:uncharacterized membrane protein YdjX (TVP38/TMEM64 family)
MDQRMKTLRGVGLAALLVAAVALVVTLPIKEYAARFIDAVRDLGPWGPIALAAVYVPACIFFIPGSLLTLGAGFAFGVVRGTLAVSVGSVLGVTAAFLVSRWLARSLVEEKLAKSARFHALDQAVAEQGAKIVLLARLSPVFPFNVLNYAFGLTNVRLRDYVLASWIGMLPGTLLYVYLGSAVQNLTDLVGGDIQGGAATKAFFFVGLAATIIVTVLVTRVARRALAAAVPDSPVSR